MSGPSSKRLSLGAFLQREHKLLIDGEWVASQSGELLSIIDPSTEEVLSGVPSAGPDEVAAAVAAAVQAQPQWAAAGLQKRQTSLLALANHIEAASEELAFLEALDSGNPIRAMRRDIAHTVEEIRGFCALAHSLRGETIPSDRGGLHHTLHEPYGVVARIVPFNHPLLFAATKIAAPLLTGNTVVLKPAHQTPLSALYLGELLRKCLPPGTINIVRGAASTGDALVRDPRIKRIAFTGSFETGRAIQRSAAEVDVKHVSLELGGKNPMLVFPDADLERAADGVILGMNLLVCQGQSCGSNSRIFVHEAIHDALVRRVVEKMAALRMGPACQEETDMGPLVDKRQYERVQDYIANGLEEGARLIAGGGRPEGMGSKGYFITPTLFTDVDVSARIAREEIFGPVMSFFRWSDPEQAIIAANQVPYGLTASVWTHDLVTAHRMAHRVQAGYVWINEHGPHYFGTPFGGQKSSGLGREESQAELFSYLETKSVHVLLH